MRWPIVGAIFRAVTNILDDLNFHLTIGFAAYFVIGYTLVYIIDGLTKKWLVVGSFCFLIGVGITFFEMMISSSREAAGSFMQHYQVGILLQSSGLLLLMKAAQKRKIVLWLRRLGPLTLGIYIIHPMIIETLQHFGITSLLFNPIISIPLLSLVIFSVASLIVYLLLKTPMKKILTTTG